MGYNCDNNLDNNWDDHWDDDDDELHPSVSSNMVGCWEIPTLFMEVIAWKIIAPLFQSWYFEWTLGIQCPLTVN